MLYSHSQSFLCRFFVIGCSMLLGLVSTAAAQNGLLGIFFDQNGSECAGDIAVGTSRTLYVVLLPQGATRGGIKGGEFRLNTDDARGYVFQGEEVIVPDAIVLGDILGDGATMGFADCQSDIAIPIMRFQALNVGSGQRGTTIKVEAKKNPSNPFFNCSVAVQCDEPTYLSICIDAGRAVLNPTGQVDCDSSAESAEWSRVKGLYR